MTTMRGRLWMSDPSVASLPTVSLFLQALVLDPESSAELTMTDFFRRADENERDLQRRGLL